MSERKPQRVRCEIPKCVKFTSNPKEIVLVGHPTEPMKRMQICEDCSIKLAHVQATMRNTAKIQ